MPDEPAAVNHRPCRRIYVRSTPSGTVPFSCSANYRRSFYSLIIMPGQRGSDFIPFVSASLTGVRWLISPTLQVLYRQNRLTRCTMVSWWVQIKNLRPFVDLHTPGFKFRCSTQALKSICILHRNIDLYHICIIYIYIHRVSEKLCKVVSIRTLSNCRQF